MGGGKMGGIEISFLDFIVFKEKDRGAYEKIQAG
jgi:hypothetical protein